MKEKSKISSKKPFNRLDWNTKICILALLAVFLCTGGCTNLKEEEQNCFGALTNPTSNATLPSVLLNSGKMVMDMGQMDACEAEETTQFVSVNAGMLWLGLCLPKECTGESLKVVQDALNLILGELGMGGGAQVYPPKEVEPAVDGITIFGAIFFSGLLAICLIGIVCEYTNLFGTPLPHNYDELNDGAKDKELVKSKSKVGLFFLSFSISRNLRKTFWTPQRADDHLSVLNGIRVISMGYIIFGHTHELLTGMPILNFNSFNDLLADLYTTIMMGGFFSVDVFFFMSAFLATYLMIQKFYGQKCMNFGMIYLHRVIRLAPTLALFIFFVIAFFKFFGSGPIWYPVTNTVINLCKEYWWTNVLFINNFYPKQGTMCIGVLWYLANDMQFFLVLPFVVLAYINKRLSGYLLASFIMVASIAVTFTISHVEGHSAFMLNDDKNAIQIYHRPYSRIHAYMVGVIFGMMYFEFNHAKTHPEAEGYIGATFYNCVRDNRCVRWILYLLGSFIMVFLIFIPYVDLQHYPGRHLSQLSYDFINAYQRPLFVFGMGIFIAGPITGKGSLLRFVLGGSAWAPWAKVTFLAYVTHVFIIALFQFQAYQGWFVTKRGLIFIFLAVFMITYLVSVPLSMFFESPIMQLERLLIFPPKKGTEKMKENGNHEKKYIRLNESELNNDTFQNSNYSKLESTETK